MNILIDNWLDQNVELSKEVGGQVVVVRQAFGFHAEGASGLANVTILNGDGEVLAEAVLTAIVLTVWQIDDLGNFHDVHAKLALLVQQVLGLVDVATPAGGQKCFLLGDATLDEFNDNFSLVVAGDFPFSQQLSDFPLQLHNKINVGRDYC